MLAKNTNENQQTKVDMEEGTAQNELVERYLKPHFSGSTCQSSQKEHHSESEETGKGKKKISNNLRRFSHIPTFSEKELRVYQKLGEGKFA